MEEDQKQLSRLCEAINDNKPWIVISTLKKHSELITRVLSTSRETPLMMTMKRGCSSEYIAKIIEMTPEGGLSLSDDDGNTALHMVAMAGNNTELAEQLLEKCPNLLLIRNNKEDLPIHVAVKQGHRDMKDYLLKMAKQQGYDDPFAGVNREDLLHSAISAGMNDVIIALSYNNPDLVFKYIDEKDEPRDEPVKDTKKLLDAIVNYKILHIREILRKNPQLMTARLTTSGETPIMVAAKRGSKLYLIEMLIKEMSDHRKELAEVDCSGNTVLHKAAMLGSTQLAKLLLMKCPNLLRIQNYTGDLPICVSIKQGHRHMSNYLFRKAKEEGHDDLFGGAASVDVICAAIRGGMYDIVYWLCAKYKRSSVKDSSVLEALAGDPSAFHENAIPCWKAALLQTKNCIFRNDFSPHNPLGDLVRHTCMHVESVGYEKASSIFKEPFLLAVRNGIEDIVKQILERHPDAINFVDEDKHSIFHLAVIYRQENIFKLAYQNNVEVSRRLSSMPDNKGNNVLHLAGYPTRQNRLDQSTSGVILQMQYEIKWFKELENLLSPHDMKLKNDLGKIPLTVFNEEHKDLATTEIKWVNGMASACSVAASLIATVAFAAAITVPGGHNSNGLPIFSNRKCFQVFAVSDALALFASITCVLSFLSIFTSRYGVDDFLYALPKRLIIGLISLFIAAMFLMIAFGTTLFLVFGQENPVILILIFVFSCAPVMLYAILQLPSLLNMIKSTYGRKLSRKRDSIKLLWRMLSRRVR